MDLRRIEEAIKDSKGGITEKKEVVSATYNESVSPGNDDDDDGDQNTVKSSIDSGKALQLFLDHIPIGSIPHFIIQNPFPELVIKTTDSVGYAIQLMYEKNICVAPVIDRLDSKLDKRQQYPEESIGIIGLGSIILWFLQEENRSRAHREDNGGLKKEDENFFSMLERNPPIAQTKVGELAKLFLWEPFFPIHMNDSLFHLLLLFSKHQLQVVPVAEKSNRVVSGFISQTAAIRTLLESSGLEWFDNIADRALSDFRFGNKKPGQIFGDQNMVEAIRALWESKHGCVAVVERETGRLIGSVRSGDMHLLLTDVDLYSDRKNLKVDQFIQLDATRTESNLTSGGEGADLLMSGRLSLQKGDAPLMVLPVTSRKTDTLKKAMKQLADTDSNVSILIDEYYRVEGFFTLNDIMVQFAPPCMDISRINGGGFFNSALEQSGCQIKGGTLVCDQQ